ncbi:hypothetical protein [Aureimonas sp. N4]|uniref:hypothetical protein n=1 Tax=Aureimonas sp. N4 TaxID=1638165 RepID=UPI0012E3AB90|nr:hypothetical protein [Aureimonas sp. N4]
MKERRKRERKRRPTVEEVADANQYPRRHVEDWIAGHISTSELCERFGFEGQEADLAAFRPFSEIAARHGVSHVDVALVHNRMSPQPPGWPEQVPTDVWEETMEALRRDDLARIAAGDADDLLRAAYDTDGADD